MVAITNYHKLDVLTTQTYFLQLCGLEVQRESHWVKIKLSAIYLSEDSRSESVFQLLQAAHISWSATPPSIFKASNVSSL